MWSTILSWLEVWQQWREQRQALAHLQAENERLSADLAAAHVTISQLRQSYQFYFDAYCTSTQERAHAR